MLSHLYNDPKIPENFGGSDRAYRARKNSIPSLTKKQVKLGSVRMAYTLHHSSQKNISSWKNFVLHYRHINFVLHYKHINFVVHLWETDLVDMMKLLAHDVSACASDVSACAGDVSACAGDVSACAGDVSACAGDVSACAGDVSMGIAVFPIG